MKCNIVRNIESDKIAKVIAPNGKESNLYKTILDNIPDSIELDSYVNKAFRQGKIKDFSKEEVAAALWSKVHSPNFEFWYDGKRDGNNEPIPEVKEDILVYQNKDENDFMSVLNEGEFKIELEQTYEQLDQSDVNSINPNLDKKLTAYLNDIGVDVQLVDKITDENGKPINAYGKAKLTEQIIQLVDGKRDESTLAEETAHMITAMLGKNHPIVKQMMSRIDQYDVYKEVVQQYAEKYNNDEDLLRFEAVGKLIGRNIVKRQSLPQEQRIEANDWFSRVKRVLKNLLSNFTFDNVRNEIDVFERFADDILAEKYKPSSVKGFGSELYQMKTAKNIALDYNINTSGFFSKQLPLDNIKQDLRKAGLSDIGIKLTSNGNGYYMTRNGKFFNPLQDMYQLSGKSQSEIVEKLDSFKDTIKDYKKLDDLKRETYVDAKTGETISRVTHKQDDLFRKNKTQAEIDAIRNSSRSVVSREAGTLLHNVMQDNIDYLANTDKFTNIRSGRKLNKVELPDGVSIQHGKMIKNSINYLMEHINNTQKEIDPNGIAEIRTELFIRGIVDKKDTGGTIDLAIVYSDGSMSLYDFKFINFKKEKIDGKWQVPNEPLTYIKTRAYDMQIGTYKEMLRNELEIDNFRESRILPNNIQFKTKNGETLPEIVELETFGLDKEYLTPTPVTRELTNNKKFNEILTVLFDQVDVLDSGIKKSFRNKKKLRELQIKRANAAKAIRSIQLKSDITPLLEGIKYLSTVGIHNIDKMQEANAENLSELMRLSIELSLFKSMTTTLAGVTRNKELYTEISVSSTSLDVLKGVIDEKRKELLLMENPDILKNQKEMGYLERNFGFMSQMNHPIFQTARKYISAAFGKTYTGVQQIIAEAKEQREKLKQWTDSRGISLMDAYRMLRDKNLNKLIFTYSKEFYNKRKQAFNEGDIQWLRENYKLTEEGKKKYKEDLKQIKKDYELTIPNDEMRKYLIEKWIRENNLENDSGWKNRWALYAYAEIKNPEKWYSDEYKNLLKPENKPLKDYFDWYIKTNRNFNTMVGERIDDNFIAYIKKDAIDMLSQNGNIESIIKGGLNNFRNSLQVRQNDEMMGVEDEMDIPLLHYDNFMYKDADGNYVEDSQGLNEDLTYNMILFAEAVHKKHNMEEIKDIMSLLKDELASQKVIKTDEFGKPIKKHGEFIYEESSRNLDTFERLVKAMVYGKDIQNKDFRFNLFGKTISANKAVRSAMSYFSMKSLSLNYVSAFGNLMGAYGNMYIKGVDGNFFTVNQITKAHNLFIKRGKGDLYNHLANYFNIEKDHWLRENASNLSASMLTKNLTFDKAYILQQKGDEFVSNSILVAMMHNYGLDSTGYPKKLSKLPAGTKPLIELASVKNDKINIEGLTDEGFIKFRNMVKYVSRQIKGTNTKEDMSVMQTHILGKALTQFRNWMAPMVKERFGAIRNTKEVDEWEYGRYRSFAKLMKDNFIKTSSRLALDLLTFNAIKFKGDTKLLEQQYQQYKDDNKDFGELLSKEEYLALRERTMRAAVAEMRMVLAFMVVLGALRADWDDDGKEDYKKYFLTRQASKLIGRAYLELSFFSNPASFNELLKTPVPIVGLLIDAKNLFENTITETGDTLGDILLNIEDDSDKDKTPKFHYTGKFVIGFRFLSHLYEDYLEDDKIKK